MPYLKIFTALEFIFALAACSPDDSRLVGRWQEEKSLSCQDYREVETDRPISMLRFNENGDFALSFTDGVLVYKGTYSAEPAADGATDGANKLSFTITKGAKSPELSLNGRYEVSENHLTLWDIRLNDKAAAVCGHTFKRR